MIVRTDGIVKVLDFGIAKLGEKRLGQTTDRSGTDRNVFDQRAGNGAGHSQIYVSRTGPRTEVDARSDIFSLGSVIYELVTGKPHSKAIPPAM